MRLQRQKQEDTKQKFSFAIPIISEDRVVNIPKHLEGVVHQEFLARYMEELGISATPANQAHMKKKIPIKQMKILGSHLDHFQVGPAGHLPRTEQWLASQDDILSTVVRKGELIYQDMRENIVKASELMSSSSRTTRKLGEDKLECTICLVHTNKMHNYIRYAKDRNASVQAPEAEIYLSDTLLRSREKAIMPNIQSILPSEKEEIQRPLSTDDKKIHDLQMVFLQAFPFSAFKLGLQLGDLMRQVQSILLSKKMKQLIALMAHHLYWTLFIDYATMKLPISQQEKSMLAMQRLHLALESKIRTFPHYTLFHLPLFLDSICSTVMRKKVRSRVMIGMVGTSPSPFYF